MTRVSFPVGRDYASAGGAFHAHPALAIAPGGLRRPPDPPRLPPRIPPPAAAAGGATPAPGPPAPPGAQLYFATAKHSQGGLRRPPEPPVRVSAHRAAIGQRRSQPQPGGAAV